MNANVGSADNLPRSARLVMVVALGTILGGAVQAVGPIAWNACFTRPAVVQTERWTPCDYAVETCDDSDLEQVLGKRGQAGWQVVASRRAVRTDGSACYEFVLCRPRSVRNVDEMVDADFAIQQSMLNASIARLEANQKLRDAASQ
jgi:hypothetical protein